jgi:hypothetical protein
MPPILTRLGAEKRPPDFARTYEALGVRFVPNGDPVQLRAEECPFCGGAKFYLNRDDGRYDCKSASCGPAGNVITFLSRVHAEYLAATTPADYSGLGKARGIAPQTLERHEFAFIRWAGEWLIPFKSTTGSVVNLMRYLPDKPKPNKLMLPGLPTALYGFEKLMDSDNKDKDVLLCEGPLDAVALDYNIGPKNRGRYVIVAIPGTFKEQWAEHFRDRRVRCLFDNDDGGRAHTRRVSLILGESGIAAELKALKWPDGTRDGYDLNDAVNDSNKRRILSWLLRNCYAIVRKPKLIIQHGRRAAGEERPIEWVWRNHLPCGTYIRFSGPQGTFKTTIALCLCAQYTRGKPMPTMVNPSMPPGHVLYIYAEDFRDEVEDGFEWAGGEFAYWHSIPAKVLDGGQLNVLDNLGEIEQLIREYGIRLVVIDGQNSVVGAPDIRTDFLSRSNVSNPLHGFAQRLNICLIGICNEDGDSRALGPQSLGDIGRCVMRTYETDPKGTNPPYCVLQFVKVSSTARSNYPPIPYSVRDHGGSHREILWGRSRPKAKAAAEPATPPAGVKGGGLRSRLKPSTLGRFGGGTPTAPTGAGG